MMKSEFEKLIGMTICNEKYRTIEYVYTWHPSIDDVKGKQQMADLYKIGGMSIIKSMVDVAKKAQVIENKMADLRAEMRKLETEREILRTGAWDCGLTDDEIHNSI